MGRFNNDRRSGGGGFRGGRSSGGRGGFGGGREQKEMFDAVCDNCGRDCQVPFRPTGEKPVYCSDCFGKQGGNERRDDRRGGRDSFKFDFRDNNREQKEMFDAVCDNCGRDCQVPFRPTSGKPIFCSDCFEERGNSRDGLDDRRSEKREFKQRESSNSEVAFQIAELNSKLDRILSVLEPKTVKEAAPKAVLKAAVTVEKPATKKETKPKKTAAKKAPAKKEAKKAATKKKKSV